MDEAAMNQRYVDSTDDLALTNLLVRYSRLLSVYLSLHTIGPHFRAWSCKAARIFFGVDAGPRKWASDKKRLTSNCQAIRTLRCILHANAVTILSLLHLTVLFLEGYHVLAATINNISRTPRAAPSRAPRPIRRGCGREMPTTKRLKGGNAAKAAKAAQPSQPKPAAADDRPTPAEVEEEEHPFVQLARKTWLKPGKKAAAPKVKADVLKQGIWEVLERDAFSYKALRLLESLQVLESYLWPGYNEEASNFHVLLIAMIVNVKRREHLETWSTSNDCYWDGCK